MDIPLGSRPKPKRFPWILGFLVAAFLVGLLFSGFQRGGLPTVQLTPSGAAVGRSATVTVAFAEPGRGLASVEVELVQGDFRTTLAEETFATPSPWLPYGDGTTEHTLTVQIGKDHQEALKEGNLKVEATATGAPTWLFAGQAARNAIELPVRLTPPTLGVTAREIYVTQGGAEAVTYAVGPTSVRDGVVAGRWFFPGYPHPNGQPGERLALFAVPYDMSDAEGVQLVAEDDVGNKSSTPFIENFRPKPYDTDTINVSDAFMRKVVPKIRARTPDLPDKGSLLDNYVAINSELREANNARLEALAKDTQPRFLWTESFVQMPAKVVSSFADRRTYTYKGKKVDQQDHLGFDLASFRRAAIPAANDGIVVMSEYLGIYGNSVVIDHGLGLMSLYAHCSSVSVKPGDRVKRGQTIGRTGATGLALGDHLHFTMLLAGLPVTPLEWWDGHWIQDRIKRKLPGVFETDKE